MKEQIEPLPFRISDVRDFQIKNGRPRVILSNGMEVISTTEQVAKIKRAMAKIKLTEGMIL